MKDNMFTHNHETAPSVKHDDTLQASITIPELDDALAASLNQCKLCPLFGNDEEFPAPHKWLHKSTSSAHEIDAKDQAWERALGSMSKLAPHQTIEGKTKISTSEVPRIAEPDFASTRATAIEGKIPESKGKSVPTFEPDNGNASVVDINDPGRENALVPTSKTVRKFVKETQKSQKPPQERRAHENAEWIWYHKEVLFIALAQLIIDENERAKKTGGEPILIGKNLDLLEKDVPKLYHYFNKVWSKVYDSYNNESCNEGCACPDCLLIGFGEANQQDQAAMSLKSFEKMKKSGLDDGWDHWVHFDFNKLCESWSWVVHKSLFGREGLCNDILSTCWRRMGHYCSRRECSGSTAADETLLNAMIGVEGIERYHRAIRDALEGPEPSPQKALAALSKAKAYCDKSLWHLDIGIQDEKSTRRGRGPFALSAHEARNEDASSYDGPIEDEIFLTNVYTLEEFIFNLYIIQVAAPQVLDHRKMQVEAPKSFKDLWRSTDDQRSLTAEDIKETVAYYRASLLSRSGHAPALLINRLYWILLELSLEREHQPGSLFPSFADLTRRGRGSLSEACASQAIELYVDQVIENQLAELTDFGWFYKRGTSFENAVARYENELARGKFSLDAYLPPGYRQLSTLQDRRVRAWAWIFEVIQPISDWIRKKEWLPSAKDRESEEGQAYQRVLNTKAILFHQHMNFVEQLLPDNFLRSEPSVQWRMALEVVHEDAKNRAELKVLATKLLTQSAIATGIEKFRSASSPAIVSAANATFQMWGGKLLPFEGSIFCECADEEEHARVETEALAYDVAEYLPVFLERKFAALN